LLKTGGWRRSAESPLRPSHLILRAFASWPLKFFGPHETFDFLVLGQRIAGLSFALKVATTRARGHSSPKGPRGVEYDMRRAASHRSPARRTRSNALRVHVTGGDGWLQGKPSSHHPSGKAGAHRGNLIEPGHVNFVLSAMRQAKTARRDLHHPVKEGGQFRTGSIFCTPRT